MQQPVTHGRQHCVGGTPLALLHARCRRETIGLDQGVDLGIAGQIPGAQVGQRLQIVDRVRPALPDAPGREKSEILGETLLPGFRPADLAVMQAIEKKAFGKICQPRAVG